MFAAHFMCDQAVRWLMVLEIDPARCVLVVPVVWGTEY